MDCTEAKPTSAGQLGLGAKCYLPVTENQMGMSVVVNDHASTEPGPGQH